jgi:hypothetical protein
MNRLSPSDTIGWIVPVHDEWVGDKREISHRGNAQPKGEILADSQLCILRKSVRVRKQ